MVSESALDTGQCHDVSVHTYTRTYLHTRFTVWARTRTKYVYGPQICEFPAFGSPAPGRQLLTNNPLMRPITSPRRCDRYGVLLRRIPYTHARRDQISNIMQTKPECMYSVCTHLRTESTENVQVLRVLPAGSRVSTACGTPHGIPPAVAQRCAPGPFISHSARTPWQMRPLLRNVGLVPRHSVDIPRRQHICQCRVG